jgi:hypothetical protein
VVEVEGDDVMREASKEEALVWESIATMDIED